MIFLFVEEGLYIELGERRKFFKFLKVRNPLLEHYFELHKGHEVSRPGLKYHTLCNLADINAQGIPVDAHGIPIESHSYFYQFSVELVMIISMGFETAMICNSRKLRSSFIEIHGISWDFVGIHGISWESMGFHGISWDFVGIH